MNESFKPAPRIDVLSAFLNNSGHFNEALREAVPGYLYQIVTARIEKVLAAEPLKVPEWRQMGKEQYQQLVAKRKEIFAATALIGDPKIIAETRLNHDDFYETHLNIVTDRTLALIHHPEFRDLVEPGCSPFLALAQAQLHDFSREVFNGGKLPLWLVDWTSDALIGRVFPGFPIRFHTIDWELGISEPDTDRDVGPSIFKALDTKGKPGVIANQFFEPGGSYEGWKEKAKGLFPQLVPLMDGSTREVNLEQYSFRDKLYTQWGLDNIGRVINSSPDEFIQTGINRFSPNLRSANYVPVKRV